jgi:hypothetical protein
MAHTEGSLDYSRSSRYDYRWALLETWTFDVLEDKLAARLNEMTHLWHCSAAQLTEWDEKETKFEHHRKEANRSFRDVGKLLLPWYKRWHKTEEKSLAQLWREFKEQEKDPVYAKRLAEARSSLVSLQKESGTQSALMEVILAARQAEAARMAAEGVKRQARRKQQSAKLRK